MDGTSGAQTQTTTTSDSYTIVESGSTADLPTFTETLMGSDKASETDTGNQNNGGMTLSAAGAAAARWRRKRGRRALARRFPYRPRHISGTDRYTATQVDEDGDTMSLLEVWVDASGSSNEGSTAEGSSDDTPVSTAADRPVGGPYSDSAEQITPQVSGSGPVNVATATADIGDAQVMGARGRAATQMAAPYLQGGGLAQPTNGTDRSGGDVQQGYAEAGPALNMQSCFAARTPLLVSLTESKFIEEFKNG